MADGEKPYRLYRGGRVKGKVPLRRHAPGTAAGGASRGNEGSPRKQRKPPRWGRRITIGLAVILVLVVSWGAASYLSFSRGIDEANARLPTAVRNELTAQDGLLTSTPSVTLVLGTDGSTVGGRSDARRSDSIMLIRTDPRTHRLAYLSIPRDLRVDIPGYGASKINAAFQLGGPLLALRTVKALTGLEINHIAMVDFDSFRDLIDATGGVEITVPKPILSNRFDCPFATSAACANWDGWRFAKGTQHMNGQRALIYSRIRENRLDASETDFDRARRQQQVIQATADKLTGIGTALRLPFIGGKIVSPLTTDLSAGQILQLGWVYFRAGSDRALHCRLGGDPSTFNGESVILGSEDNSATIGMFTGRSSPLPPQRGFPYAPGCTVGSG
jgi:LCP family protein required for cell wall assembly